MVDLHTGKMRPHRPDDYITKITAVAPGGDVPLWLQFLDAITGGDVELHAFLQRIAGYSLTGVTREHALFFFYGTGANGKGMFLNTLAASSATTPPCADGDLHRQPERSTGIRPTSPGCAARAWSPRRRPRKAGAGPRARIKALTGGDPITARFMRQDFFTYHAAVQAGHRRQPQARPARCRRGDPAPLPPGAVHRDHSNAERDSDLPDKLKAEWPGILQWMIEGCLAWQAKGLAPPATVLIATDNYLQAEDAISNWIRERCKRIEYGGTKSSRLYSDWCTWSKAAGEDPGSQKRFSQALEDKGYVKDPKARHATFRGIALDLPGRNP